MRAGPYRRMLIVVSEHQAQRQALQSEEMQGEKSPALPGFFLKHGTN